MTAVWARVRAEFRARWKAWAAIAVLVGVGGGAVLVTAVGAHRTDTAYRRFLRSSRAADVLVSPENTGLGGYDAALRVQPGVAALGTVVGIDTVLAGGRAVPLVVNAAPTVRWA